LSSLKSAKQVLNSHSLMRYHHWWWDHYTKCNSQRILS
jgi:hypothetical protein